MDHLRLRASFAIARLALGSAQPLSSMPNLLALFPSLLRFLLVYQKRVKSGGRIFQRLACKQASEDASFNDDKVPCNTPKGYTESRCVSLCEGMTSSSTDNGDAFMSSGEYVRDHGSLLSLQPWIFRTGDYQRDEELVKPNDDCSEKYGYEMDGFMYNSLPEISPQSVSLGYACGRGRRSLRTRRSHCNSIKPLSSTKNCLIPQLYDANFEIEEFVFSITFDTGMDKGNMKNVPGVSPLPELRTPKRKSRETPNNNLGPFNSQISHMISHQKVLLCHPCRGIKFNLLWGSTCHLECHMDIYINCSF
ncbi:hypothetical protein OPV22_003556 [Ensete ventricosum]|uniref:Uncharacterized protein n=1 Tax=Ensete ventricosum TaxID=4639 RepID=A0AAV8S0Y5_ENSVE|nr:hypothetical protein OPV22_003556 [Ensete ventricosum]